MAFKKSAEIPPPQLTSLTLIMPLPFGVAISGQDPIDQSSPKCHKISVTYMTLNRVGLNDESVMVISSNHPIVSGCRPSRRPTKQGLCAYDFHCSQDVLESHAIKDRTNCNLYETPLLHVSREAD